MCESVQYSFPPSFLPSHSNPPPSCRHAPSMPPCAPQTLHSAACAAPSMPCTSPAPCFQPKTYAYVHTGDTWYQNQPWLYTCRRHPLPPTPTPIPPMLTLPLPPPLPLPLPLARCPTPTPTQLPHRQLRMRLHRVRGPALTLSPTLDLALALTLTLTPEVHLRRQVPPPVPYISPICYIPPISPRSLLHISAARAASSPPTVRRRFRRCLRRHPLHRPRRCRTP